MATGATPRNGCSAVFEQGQGKVPVQARGCGGVGYRRKAGAGEDDCTSTARQHTLERCPNLISASTFFSPGTKGSFSPGG